MNTKKIAIVVGFAALVTGAFGCGPGAEGTELNQSTAPTEQGAGGTASQQETAPPKDSKSQCYLYWRIIYKYSYKMRAIQMDSCGYPVCEYWGLPTNNLYCNTGLTCPSPYNCY